MALTQTAMPMLTHGLVLLNKQIKQILVLNLVMQIDYLLLILMSILRPQSQEQQTDTQVVLLKLQKSLVLLFLS